MKFIKHAVGVGSPGQDSQVSALGDPGGGNTIPQAKQSRRRASGRKDFSLKIFKFKTESLKNVK